MKIILTICIYLLCIISTFAQNNNIFTGGAGDGYAELAVSQSYSPKVVNNNIFNGGQNDGHHTLVVSQIYSPQSVNNNIFTGGQNDGHYAISVSQVYSPQVVNNAIFSGGQNDGHHALVVSQIYSPQSVNNNIFTGGSNDGHHSLVVSQLYSPQVVNNSIFAGGQSDGHDARIINKLYSPQIVNNSIFSGGINDGHDSKLIILDQSVIIWHGTTSSDWFTHSNWDLNRSPTTSDVIIINTHDYNPQVLGYLTLGNTGYDYLGKEMIVLEGSTVHMSDYTLEVYTKLILEGKFEIQANNFEPSILIFNGATIDVKDTGELLILPSN